MANYPLLSPADIIKHVDISKNYRIQKVNLTRRRTFIISQFAQIEDVNPSDIEAEL